MNARGINPRPLLPKGDILPLDYDTKP